MRDFVSGGCHKTVQFFHGQVRVTPDNICSAISIKSQDKMPALLKGGFRKEIQIRVPDIGGRPGKRGMPQNQDWLSGT